MNVVLSLPQLGGLIALGGLVIAFAKYEDYKHNRIFERVDEIKNTSDKKFVLKDVCSVVHEQLKADIIEIKHDVKKLLTKNGIK